MPEWTFEKSLERDFLKTISSRAREKVFARSPRLFHNTISLQCFQILDCVETRPSRLESKYAGLGFGREARRFGRALVLGLLSGRERRRLGELRGGAQRLNAQCTFQRLFKNSTRVCLERASSRPLSVVSFLVRSGLGTTPLFSKSLRIATSLHETESLGPPRTVRVSTHHLSLHSFSPRFSQRRQSAPCRSVARVAARSRSPTRTRTAPRRAARAARHPTRGRTRVSARQRRNSRRPPKPVRAPNSASVWSRLRRSLSARAGARTSP